MPTDPTSPNPDDPRADLVEHYRDLLDGFLDLAVELRELVRLQVKAETAALATPTEPPPDTLAAPTASTIPTLIASYDRLTRAVRRTILLCQALDHPPIDHAFPAQTPRLDPVAVRKHILRDVQNRIARDAKPDHAETLGAELLERLEDPEIDADILTRPIPEIVTDIVRDLGLCNFSGPPAFQRRTPEDIRTLCAQAAQAADAARAAPPRSTPSNAYPAISPANTAGSPLLHRSRQTRR